MNNFRYKLTNIKTIEKIPVLEKISKNDVVVRPSYLSICQADKRYYFGKRDAKVLNKKLPLCLIHEAIGIVSESMSEKFKKGDKVILFPNVSSLHKENENYEESSKFMSSSIDGFMQENVVINDSNLIKIDNEFKNYEVLVLSELLSCIIHSVESNIEKISKAKTIAIYGDGNLSYLLHLYLLERFENKKSIIVFGIDKNKLEMFSKNVEVVNILDKKQKKYKYDVCFEVVGGSATNDVINKAIENINPNGLIILMGVSENKVSINTRLILEKGLTIIGRSRSSINDFYLARDFIYKNFQEVKKIISKIIDVRSIEDIHKAFDISSSSTFKTIMKWNI